MAALDITNFLQLKSSAAAALESAAAATLTWGRATFPNLQQIGQDAYYFSTEWEPPFKAVKQLSKEYPEVHFTLWADAFIAHHWLCKSVFEGGKSEDWVVSLVDDEFEQIFAEIYGQDHSRWKANPQAPFAHLLATSAAL